MCAVIKRGILGGFQNKIANVVGGSWKGIAYMRSLPISVANPRTAAQTAQRDKFAGAVKAASELLPSIVKPLWDRFAQYKSGYNAFIAANIDYFTGGFIANPVDLVLSQGTLAYSAISSIVADVSLGTIVINFNPTPIGDGSATDEIYAACYSGSAKVFEGFAIGQPRSTGIATMTPSFPLVAGQTYYAYLAFRNPEGTKVSVNDAGSTIAVA